VTDAQQCSAVLEPTVVPACRVALAKLGEEVDVATQRQEREGEHVQHHRRRRRRRQEQGAGYGDHQEQQHVAATAPNVGAGSAGTRGSSRTIHVRLTMRVLMAAVRPVRRLARVLGCIAGPRRRRALTRGRRSVHGGLAVVRMAGPARSGRALQRRRRQRATDRAHARSGGALQRAQLTPEVGDRRVRSVFDA